MASCEMCARQWQKCRIRSRKQWIACDFQFWFDVIEGRTAAFEFDERSEREGESGAEESSNFIEAREKKQTLKQQINWTNRFYCCANCLHFSGVFLFAVSGLWIDGNGARQYRNEKKSRSQAICNKIREKNTYSFCQSLFRTWPSFSIFCWIAEILQ